MKFIPLKNSDKVAIVDDENYLKVMKYQWALNIIRGSVYSTAAINKGKWIYLHRFILNTPPGMDTDHINHNKLDNRLENLRIATRSQNMANSKKYYDNRTTSRFKGACWHKRANKWMAQITVEHRNIYLGLFQLEKEAAIAYDKAATKYFGEFARVNFPEKRVQEEQEQDKKEAEVLK